MKEDEKDDEPVDPEWVEGEADAGAVPPVAERLHSVFGPIVGGLIIDGLDFVTFGPLGILFGALIGGSVAYYITSVERLPVWQRTVLATVAGFYCAFPFTNFIPAATLVGALIRFVQSGKRRTT